MHICFIFENISLCSCGNFQYPSFLWLACSQLSVTAHNMILVVVGTRAYNQIYTSHCAKIVPSHKPLGILSRNTFREYFLTTILRFIANIYIYNYCLHHAESCISFNTGCFLFHKTSLMPELYDKYEFKGRQLLMLL